MPPGTKTPGQLSKHTLDFYLSQLLADGGKQKCGCHTVEKGIREIRIFLNPSNFTDFEPKVLRYHQSKREVCKAIDTGNQGDHQTRAEMQSAFMSLPH